MKLSVSAYRAHASAHKKILDTAYQLNYGSTASASLQPHVQCTSATPPNYKVDQLLDDNASSPGTGTAVHSAVHPGPLSPTDNNQSGSDTPVNSPRSPLNTSRDEDEDSSVAASSDCKSPSQRCEQCASTMKLNGSDDEAAGAGASSSTGGGVKGATQSWRNIRAVMAYYNSLRKIKRTKSNQRWMKLRTTVQLSSAIQKKPPLKREDSFLKRFSTRQIPETQETVEDTGSEAGTGGAAGTGSGFASSAARRRRRATKHPRTVVNPDENFYFYWLLALTVCVLYNLWTLIVRQSFPEFQQLIARFWYSCDALSDAVFFFDLGVQLRTGYLEQGLMVYDAKKLAGHYVRSRAFLLDLGALCPLDLLQARLGTQPMLRFPRFLKVYRAINYYYMVESRTVWPNLWRVLNLIHILLILAHWFGCFYFLLSEAEGFRGDWVYPYRPGDYATLTRKYLGSLYWSTLTLTTIGDLPTPETNAEKGAPVDGLKSLPRRGLKSRLLQFNTDGGYVFTIVSYLIGVFIFATIVGQVGNVITNRNANRLEFERLLDGAKTYMRHHKVPGGMKKRVLRWYDYSWSRGRIQGGGDINTALGLLPDKLKTELALHVNLSVLKKVTIFQECQPEFLHDLVLKMKAYIFTPGDSICRKGEVAREMFIIADGILEVLSETGRVLTTMKAGDFFGEIGILNLDGLNKRTADVRSVGYSELFSLSREDVLAAMKDYPEAQEILQALGRKRLMEVRNSARQSGSQRTKHHHHHRSQTHSHQAPGESGIVGKIRSEAKGLRDALRKSRTHRRSDESLELQPLHATPNKGVLRRMPRVRSDEMGREEDTPDPGGGDLGEMKPVVTSPLGAGLPLLSRLRLLKEKQDNEERGTTSTAIAGGTVTSPPPVADVPKEPEVIGAGLPLLQRLLLLKAKEDKAAATSTTIISPPSTIKPPLTKIPSTTTTTTASNVVTTTVTSPTSVTQQVPHSVPQSTTSRTTSPSVGFSKFAAATGVKISFRDRLLAAVKPDLPKKELITEQQSQSSTETTLTTPTTTCSTIQTQIQQQQQQRSDVPRIISPQQEQKQIVDNNKSRITTSSIIVQQQQQQQIQQEHVDSSHATVSSSSSNLQAQQPVAVVQQQQFVQPPILVVQQPPVVTEDSSGVTVVDTGENGSKQSHKQVQQHIDSTTRVVARQIDSSHIDSRRESRTTSGIIVSEPKNKTAVVEQQEHESGVECSDVCDSAVPLQPWSKLKQAAIIRDSSTSSTPIETEMSVEASSAPQLTSTRVPKPGLLQLRARAKHYESVDDLSPEYSGLPFVKKLKILNERQKLAELERVLQVRSVSLDICEPGERSDSPLTRSHSEASAMHRRAPDTSPESNETPERRSLKSILKKLTAASDSSDSSHKKSPAKAVAKSKSVVTAELRQLMRAQTVEGYAARHSKLCKSVTFNRDTMSSPPSVYAPPHSAATSVYADGGGVELSTEPLLGNVEDEEEEEEIQVEVEEEMEVEVPPPGYPPPPLPCEGELRADEEREELADVEEKSVRAEKLKLFKGSLEEHEYFGEALIAIKQVISAHLQEMQQKFQQRFDRLEGEVRARDQLIGQLRARLRELEPYNDDSTCTASDSIDTVVTITGSRRTWDEPSMEETIELLDLPDSMAPQLAWNGNGRPHAPRHHHTNSPAASVILDLDSATDTDSDAGDSSEPGDSSDTPYLHNTNWELEMLAAQMRRQRRSASLDQDGGLGRPEQGVHHRRRVLCRGYSADAGGGSGD